MAYAYTGETHQVRYSWFQPQYPQTLLMPWCPGSPSCLVEFASKKDLCKKIIQQILDGCVVLVHSWCLFVSMVGVDVCTHMLFQVDLHDLTESALVTASLHVASLSLLGRFFEILDKKGWYSFSGKELRECFFIVRMPPLHLLLAAAIFLPGQVSSIFLLSWILMLKTLLDCVPKIFLLSWCWRTF